MYYSVPITIKSKSYNNRIYNRIYGISTVHQQKHNVVEIQVEIQVIVVEINLVEIQVLVVEVQYTSKRSG